MLGWVSEHFNCNKYFEGIGLLGSMFTQDMPGETKASTDFWH